MTAPHEHGPAGELLVDIAVSAEGWPEEAEEVVLRAATAAWLTAGDDGPAELSVALVDDAAIRVLNRDYRGQDKATNVLSFPGGEPLAAAPGEPALLGDVVIAFETVEREAGDDNRPFAHHLSHMTVHGLLHLLGYDHEDEAEAEEMEALERQILLGLGIPDPYRGQ